MADDCGLCNAVFENYRVVRNTGLVYSVIPIAPLVEGHVMVLPIRHTRFQDMTKDEVYEAHQMICDLIGKLKVRYPAGHPLLGSVTDTDHAQIPDHGHYHLIPSSANFRTLMANYDPSIPRNKKLEQPELERLAVLLR